MYRPVLVTAPSILPVSLDEAKLALRVETAEPDGTVPASEFDDELTRLLRAAVSHYDGWNGLLGVCLVAQTWRQDFDDFSDIRLALGPYAQIASIKWRNSDGQLSTVSADDYMLLDSAGGRLCVRFKRSFSQPSDLYELAPVAVEYQAGWPVVDDKVTTPDDIRTAIILNVQKNFDEAARENALQIERIERDLIAKYRVPLA